LAIQECHWSLGIVIGHWGLSLVIVTLSEDEGVIANCHNEYSQTAKLSLPDIGHDPLVA